MTDPTRPPMATVAMAATKEDALAADRKARRAAQTVFDRPLILEAGAGTGKTATLVARVLAWCLGCGWTRSEEALADRLADLDAPDETPEQRIAGRVLRRLVAITFTEAAAAEMATRVATALDQVARGAWPVGVDRSAIDAATAPERAGHLLEAVAQLRVTTIHGFCRRLLADHPFEAGLMPGFEVDAQGQALATLAEQVVADAVSELYGDPGDAHALSLFGGSSEDSPRMLDSIGPPELAQALVELGEAGADVDLLTVDPFDEPARQALAARLGTAVRDLLRLLEPCPLAGTRAVNATRIVSGLRRLDLLAGEPTPPSPRRLRDAIDRELSATLGKHLAGWAKGKLNRAEQDAFGGHGPAIQRAAHALGPLIEHIRRLDPDRLQSARHVLAPLYRCLRAALDAESIVTFADLVRGAADLLRRDPALLRAQRRSIDQLLVDEFQDTDDEQCTVVRMLALDPIAGETVGPEGAADEASGTAGQPGLLPGLFVVGDPKQSIYGWRGADLGAYERFVAAAETVGGERLPLVENFRSVPAVLEEVSRLIAPTMKRVAGVQPDYVPLFPCSARTRDPGFGPVDGSPEWAPVEHWVSWPNDPRSKRILARDANEVEAAALAADLRAVHHAGVAWSDVALLVRSTTDLEPYLRAMRAAGVPYAIGRDRQYYRRREVVDAAAAVRAVLDRDDTIALLALLRSPAVGIPDAALLPLWRHGLPDHVRTMTAPPHIEPNRAGPNRAEPARAGDLERPARPVSRQQLEQIIARAAKEVPTGSAAVEALRGWRHSLLHVLDTVGALRARFSRVPIDTFLTDLRSLLLLDAAEGARYLGAYRLANLDRFFAELADDLEAAAGDCHQVLRSLRRRTSSTGGRAASGTEADGGPSRTGEGDETAGEAVQVMTIHAAKGLQFPHVYLLQTHKGSASATTGLVDLAIRERPADDTAGPAVARAASGQRPMAYRLFGATTLDWDQVEARRQATERAELVRTLYVASTRAADRLVVAGARPTKAPALDQARTHADLLGLRSGAGPSTDALGQQLAEGPGRSMHEGVAWVMPAAPGSLAAPDTDGREAGDRQAEMAPAPATRNDAEPVPRAPSTVAQDPWMLARSEHRQQAEAAHRMSRPFRIGASKLAVHSETVQPEAARGRAAAPDESSLGSPSTGILSQAGRRRIAVAAGTLVHRALEDFDLTTIDPARELADRIAWLPVLAPQLAPSPTAFGAADDPSREEQDAQNRELDAAVARARGVLEQFADGDLFARFVRLAPMVVARELPVLLPPPPARQAREEDDLPVGFVAGAIDLVYQEGDGRLVIVDFKTDPVERDASQPTIDARAAAYAEQGRVYVEALGQALDVDLDRAPRFELWFLTADRAIELDLSRLPQAPSAAP